MFLVIQSHCGANRQKLVTLYSIAISTSITFLIKSRIYKLWWSGNNGGTGAVGILVKEELCEKAVEVQKKCDRAMAVVLVF